VISPPGFEWVREQRTTALVRSDLRAWLLPVLHAADGDWRAYSTRELPGGRGGTRLVSSGGSQVVVRPYRRGGLPARLLHDTYFGCSPRPFRELCATEALRRQGAPVVEVYGAAVRWRAPGCYRGWLATRYLRGARTFWQWACTAPPADERDAVLQCVGAALHRLHDRGGRHPDLNLNNILVCRCDDAGGTPDVWFIDFDRPRLAAAFGHSPASDLARLRRSAHKLDPQGRYVTTADLARLEAAYRAS
jgi:3-deoxy-D-manno-octulosonic acid kinase